MSVKAAGIYVVVTLCVIAVVEIGLRAYDWSPPPRDDHAGDRLGESRYYHSTTGAGDLMPNQDGHWVIWFHRPYHVQTNSVGLRNTEEPAANAFRIYAIGDSQTFGPYLANEDTWPAWTENVLRRAPEAGPIQVFNAGIAGYTILDELALVREKGLAFNPSLVVLAAFENDVADLRREHGGLVQRPRSDTVSAIGRFLRRTGRSSAFVNMAERLRTQLQLKAAGVDISRGEGDAGVQRRAPEPEDDQGKYEARYGDLFRELADLLQKHDIRFATVFIPAADSLGGPPSRVEALVRRLTSETNVPYLDITPVFAAAQEPQARFYLMQKQGPSLVGNGHLSREGNAVIGRTVAAWLRREGVVASRKPATE